EKAGFRPGDAVRSLAGQPLLSIADVQWVLHNTPPDGGDVKAQARRGGKEQALTLTLPKGWRRAGDLSWRASTWGLRRMATGGMVLEELTAEERAAAGASTDGMALRVKSVGQFGPHAAAKNAGFRPGDVVISFDGKTDLAREADVLAYGVTAKKPGET